MIAMHISTTMCSQESVSFANGLYCSRQCLRSSRFCTAAPTSLLSGHNFASEMSIE